MLDCATLGERSIREGRGFCMVASPRIEGTKKGERAIKAVASQKGHRAGRMAEGQTAMGGDGGGNGVLTSKSRVAKINRSRFELDLNVEQAAWGRWWFRRAAEPKANLLCRMAVARGYPSQQVDPNISIYILPI